ncbi:MAG: amidohydrolase [Polyangiaceae bacterium]|nr:amidohydrolase [Polyangiaceae bacterium]
MVLATPARSEVVVNGIRMDVVDTHIHAGSIGDFNLRGKHAILDYLPPFVRFYHPGVLDAAANPYAAHIGLRAERDRAGIDHGVIVAAYTHHTAGFLTNRGLEDFLTDERNVAADSKPWAWGMVSINFDDFDDANLRAERIAALRSYFLQRPDLFIGIKLAHVHQNTPLNDETTYAVYDVAAEFSVPVFIHTGLLSVWGDIVCAPDLTNPINLVEAIQRYDGTGQHGRVNFILGHVGTGSTAISLQTLELAAQHENAWLDLSDLGHEALLDAQGQPIESTELMYPFVLKEIKARGLAHKTLYANGEARPGWATKYLNDVIATMIAESYTTEEIAAVLSGNFYRLFFSSSTH